jgi:hypothetical protein
MLVIGIALDWLSYKFELLYVISVVGCNGDSFKLLRNVSEWGSGWFGFVRKLVVCGQQR